MKRTHTLNISLYFDNITVDIVTGMCLFQQRDWIVYTNLIWSLLCDYCVCCSTSKLKLLKDRMKMPNSISAAEAVANHEALLLQILFRLPLKALVGFKCVSNQWLSLISSPQFISAYMSRQRTLAPSGLLINNYNFPTPELQYVPLNRNDPGRPPYLRSYPGDPKFPTAP